MSAGYEFESALVTDCRLAAGRMVVKLEVAGQRKAKSSGSDKGLPDGFLCVSCWHHPLEFKRAKGADTPAGRFSYDQLVAAQRRADQGVYTYAPRLLPEFVALVNWSRRHAPSRMPTRCTACPVVPVQIRNRNAVL